VVVSGELWWTVVNCGGFTKENHKEHTNNNILIRMALYPLRIQYRKEGEIMSKGLKGEYNHSVDAKGRMIVPSKLRELLGLSFVVTKGMDGCLYAYPSDEWELFENKLEKLPKTNKQARDFVRFFMGSASDVEIDNQGRIMIASTLRTFAGINKDVTIVGMGDHAEIWSREKWDEQNNVDDIDFEEISKGFEELGIMI